MEINIHGGVEKKDDFYDNQIEKLPDDKRQRLLQEFKEHIEQNHGLDFTIETGEINVDNIGGFSDGIYKLKNYNISPISKEEGIYLLQMDFRLKKKGIEYKHNFEISFHYENGEEMVIKYKGEFYRYRFGDKVIDKIIKKGHGARKTIIHEEVGKRVPIKIKDLKLILRFKTD